MVAREEQISTNYFKYKILNWEINNKSQLCKQHEDTYYSAPDLRFVDSFRAGAYAPARKLSTNMYDIYHCWVYSE
jgi:hypothetical protein